MKNQVRQVCRGRSGSTSKQTLEQADKQRDKLDCGSKEPGLKNCSADELMDGNAGR